MASRRRFYTSLVGLGYDSNEAPLDSGIATGHTSTALLRALERGGAMYLVEVDLPGMTLRIGTTAYDSNESGQYEPLVREIAGLSHQGPDRSSRMAGRQPSVRFDDSSRQFAQLTEGQQGPRLQGSPARIKIAHPQVRPEAWRTEFSGEVASWEFPSEFEAELILRPADRTLRRTTLVKPLGLSEWPNIGGPALGKYPPLLYGGHNSQVYTNTGLVPLLPVDTVNEYWLVSIGWTGVQRVYVEGLLTSEFDVIHLERKGRLYTVVKRTGTVAWEVEGRITADATGFESQGDGSGYLITNPAEQLSHVLVNFYFH
jgi:hypothetical protein